MVIQQFDVYWVKLDPTVGSEIRKTRPCVVVTPASVNRFLRTVLIAPITSSRKEYPTRVPSAFGGRNGEIAMDQIRCVDHSRLLKFMGRLDVSNQLAVSEALVELFQTDDH